MYCIINMFQAVDRIVAMSTVYMLCSVVKREDLQELKYGMVRVCESVRVMAETLRESLAPKTWLALPL